MALVFITFKFVKEKKKNQLERKTITMIYQKPHGNKFSSFWKI
jgi:hypothetical protein